MQTQPLENGTKVLYGVFYHSGIGRMTQLECWIRVAIDAYEGGAR